MKMLYWLPTLAIIVGLAAPAAAKKDPLASWGFELRLGGYQPAVGDNEEHSYYQRFYGNDRPLLLSLEFDRYLTYVFGSLGVFLQVGLWKNSGKSRRCTDASGNAVTCTQELVVTSSSSGTQKTQLQIIPLTVGAVYRFDLLKRDLRIPLVPYAKLGLIASYWNDSAGGKTSTFSTHDEATGWTTGLQGAVGLALNLDWISTDASDEHRLFIDSFFFAEYTQIWADGFGDDLKFDMSDSQVNFGVAFDFE